MRTTSTPSTEGLPQISSPVYHTDLGDGVVLGLGAPGYVRVFFRTVGERQVPSTELREMRTAVQRLLAAPRPPTPEAIHGLTLALEAVMLPLLGTATQLSAARVDLLPHQVVLVHRIATSRPRRFLVADEVGLGKTIQVALLVRELLSRGELNRALMVVPAGLVENWRRELNEVFHLDFEVFGTEGDVSDRKSNTFARHHRLIASVDTLKRPARIKRLLEAEPWDLVVFDEAQHLTAYRQGRKVVRTENFKLALALREHCRDLILLSATPHQGDQFRFWQLISLLNPTLYSDERDMVVNRHRLNAVVIRRTKADACDRNGGTLFMRRAVHTRPFCLSAREMAFYRELVAYLGDGYALARKMGGRGNSLGLVMTIFQKIASSSFAAVKSTLERRLLMLTIHEALDCDERQDMDGRDAAYVEAKQMLAALHGLGDDIVSRAQVDRLLADAKLALLKKLREEEAYSDTLGAEDELSASTGEEAAAALVSVALPEERRRIRQLLAGWTGGLETKAASLLDALRELWNLNPREKAVVFTTYLGSVESLRQAISSIYPHVGVEVLKGGDHGAKTAAQNRFKAYAGPAVLICTAAGREGINLQFCRVLFNHDLPWNPMDLEQRIGRIHRYGQRDTAQVFNLVAVDTLEGQVYQLLEQKLQSIARTLGKVDEAGEVAEDFRTQILGQLAAHVSYDELYRSALADPTLNRTRLELQVAMDNATRSRQVVGELFQDLERFRLEDYQELDDGGAAMKRLLMFAARAAVAEGSQWRPIAPTRYGLTRQGTGEKIFTSSRDEALQDPGVELLGLEHPIIRQWLETWSDLPSERRAIMGLHPSAPQGCMICWLVNVQGKRGQVKRMVIPIGITPDGQRQPALEAPDRVLQMLQPGPMSQATAAERQERLEMVGARLLHRHLEFTGALNDGASYHAEPLAWVEVTNRQE